MIKNDKIKAISVFSSAGIGELLLNQTNIEVIAANELLPKRAECYSHFYPSTNMIFFELDCFAKFNANKCFFFE